MPQALISASAEEIVSDYTRARLDGRDGLEAYRSQIMREGFARTPEDFERTALYQENLRPRGVRWLASAKVGQTPLALGLLRTAEQGRLTPEELDKLRGLSLALAGAIELARAFEFRRIDGGLIAFERSRQPVAIIDPDGGVLRLTPSAERLLGGDLKIIRGRIVSCNADATRALDRALNILIREGCSSVRPVVLPRKEGRPIIAYPSRLVAAPPWCFAPARALVVFRDIESQHTIDTRGLTDAFGLSASEVKLTALIVGGASIEGAAKMLDVSVHTARNQIKSVYQKTDTHSQGELISLVSRLVLPDHNPMLAR
jgi:DNA-binding CsgD family transcriptional regulator